MKNNESTESKKLVPALRFPEFANDGEWEEKTIGEILTIGNGRDYKHLSKGDVPVFGTGGYMTSVNDFLYDGETVFIGRKGTIDKPFYYRGRFWTVDTLFYTTSFNGVLPLFVYDIFQNVNWLKYNEASGVPSLSKSTIEKIIIAKPSIEEQQKIADCLSSLDKCIQATKDKVELLKEYKRGLMQKLFPARGKTIPEFRFPEFVNDGAWEEQTLGQICNITNGKANAQDHIANGLYPLFDRSEIVKASNKYLFDCEAVIIPGEGSRFAPKYYQGKFNLHQRAYALNDFKCYGLFVYFYMQNSMSLLKQKAVLSTVLSLRLPILQNFTIKLPVNPEEQQKIANTLFALDKQIDLCYERTTLLEEHKKGLMQQLFPQK